MTGRQICLFLFSSLVVGVCFAETDWTYSGPEGPDQWPSLFPTCGGQNQSPIDLAITRTSWRLYFPFKFKNYNSVTMASVLKNGHTVVLSLPDGLPDSQKPSFTGGGFTDRYVFQQLHFHWGSNDSVGSEHTVNGKSYAGEMHLVHYNSKYGNYSNALKYTDGLAVLGVFFQPSIIYNGALHPILKHLSNVNHAGDSVTIPEPVNFFQLLPFGRRKFYRYQGSLTTPPCSEIVIWTVFRYPLLLTSSQLAQFRQLTDDEGNLLVNNDRPVQPVNSRKVYFSL